MIESREDKRRHEEDLRWVNVVHEEVKRRREDVERQNRESQEIAHYYKHEYGFEGLWQIRRRIIKKIWEYLGRGVGWD